MRVMQILQKFIGFKIPNKRDSIERRRMSDATRRLIDASDTAIDQLTRDDWRKLFPNGRNDKHHERR